MSKYVREVFVFGSNELGKHGAGAAKYAVIKYGAVYGKAFGMQGNSFAIPTKDKDLKTLSTAEIKEHIDVFIKFAKSKPEYRFNVTKIGCGLAGLSEVIIAPLFLHAPKNVYLPQRFVTLLEYFDSHHPVSFDLDDKPVREVT
jgi:hypothetical protein